MLDSNSNVLPETADTATGWSENARFQVQRRVEPDTEAPNGVKKEWYFDGEFVLRCDDEGDPLERLVVEHFRDAAQREDARSISRPQELAEHQSWAKEKAKQIADRVGCSGLAAEALSLAALLHDEGKRAACWQRAFKAPREKNADGTYKVFAKTRGPIDQEILGHYRHEFGSLLHVETNAEFKMLPDDWQELVLHLVAAHHGQARPVIETRGCEDGPPSLLEERARDVALRFARLQKRWGPWGLAWWEALMRAADQQASRDNNDGHTASTNRSL